ncbi:MAG: hypothetical protein PHV63_02505 [Candidatus Daviesbacteria bacterium]|nr:hypothetical protein [Candidatus Daviesbacteria bacterium]
MSVETLSRREQAAEELASSIQETHRIPDPYHFEITPYGELFSPSARCLVKDKRVIDKTSPLGRLEYQALLSIEQWAVSRNEGVIVWVSPPYPGAYSVLKIIVSEIEYENGLKRLFNRAILFDFDENQSLEFTRGLAQFSQNQPNFFNLDQVRATPLILKTHGNFWIHALEELIDAPAVWEMVRIGEDRRLKEEALRQATMVQKEFFSIPGLYSTDEAQMAIKQVLGPYSGSCPPKTAFQVFSENSLVVGDGVNTKDPDFCRNCPVCGEAINCIVRAGQSCPSCRTVKRCG